jgi:hypothetical protein
MILITTTHKEHFSLSVRQKETPPAMPKKSLQRSQKTPLAHRQTTHSRILQNRHDQKERKKNKKHNDNNNNNNLVAQFLAVIYYRSGVKWDSVIISC